MRVLEGTPAEIAEYERIQQQGGPATVTNLNSSEMNLWTPERLAAFWNDSYGDQKKLIKLIVAKGGRVTIGEAQKHLGLKPGPPIAGVLSSITRNARKFTKYREARLVDWSKEEKNGVTTWGYYIPEQVLAMLKQVM